MVQWFTVWRFLGYEENAKQLTLNREPAKGGQALNRTT